MLIGARGAPVADPVGFWLLFTVFALSELWLQRFRRLGAGARRSDHGSRWLLGGSVWLAIGPGLGTAVTTPGWSLPLRSGALFTSGLALMALGIALRWAAVVQLGDDFTVSIGTRAGQRVRDRGAYRLVRHPSYAGSLATVLGILLCCASLLAIALVALPVLATVHRIRVEERALIEGLGDAYRSYMRRTKRLIPFVL